MKICVIGLGSMGKRRIRLLKMIAKDSMIIGIDNNPERVLSAVNECGIECYSRLSDVNAKFDCAFVCTSPQFHAKIIKECLEKDMHVFSEINLSSHLYDENICLAERINKVLFLSSTPLYRTEMKIIDERVKQNGNPCVYRYHVGQYLPDWHPWDKLADFFISNKATNGCRELFAIELPWIQHTFGKIRKVNVMRNKLLSLNLEFWDTYLVQLEHEDGNIGSLSVDVVSRQAVRKLEVYNENLYISWNGTTDSLFEKDIISGKMRQVPAGQCIHENGYGEFINEYAYLKEIESFFDSINGQVPLYCFENDKETLRIIDEIEG